MGLSTPLFHCFPPELHHSLLSESASRHDLGLPFHKHSRCLELRAVRVFYCFCVASLHADEPHYYTILHAERARPPTSVAYNVAVGRKGAAGAADVSTDMFLGHLCPIDEYRVYGYMTSTRLKLLAVLEDVNDIREPELKRVSRSRRPPACLVNGRGLVELRRVLVSA